MKKWNEHNGEKRNRAPLSEEQLEKRREKIRYIVITFVNTVIIYGIYIALITLYPHYSEWILAVYLVLLGIASFGYVIYNRAFTRKNLTVEMLPPEWSEEEKVAFIEDGKRRLQKSKWCLTVLFPLIFTFFMDIFYLFIYQEYFAPIFGQLL